MFSFCRLHLERLKTIKTLPPGTFKLKQFSENKYFTCNCFFPLQKFTALVDDLINRFYCLENLNLQ